MPITNPSISVIIPTHNRSETLLQALKALSAQTFSNLQFEVIVVADGCTDKTVEIVKSYRAIFKLQILEQEGSGAAAARNKGAVNAVGALLLFLDDDVTASPQLLEAHMKAHQEAVKRVVLGYLPPVMNGQKGYFQTKLKEWWEASFHSMHHEGSCFSYRNMLSGNFSLPAEFFRLVGGFDTTFKCQEDYELGVRLIQAGAQFIFEPKAMGCHNEKTDLNRWLNRKYSEGKAAVQLYKKHPQLRDTIPVINQFKDNFPPSYQRRLQFIDRWSSLAKAEAIIYKYALNVTEWLHMPEIWEKLLGRLQTYWFLKGMLATVDGLDSLISLLNGASLIQKEHSLVTDIKMAKGLGTANVK